MNSKEILTTLDSGQALFRSLPTVQDKRIMSIEVEIGVETISSGYTASSNSSGNMWNGYVFV